MKKLSKPMEDMIRGAVLHEVRVDGKIVRSGLMVAGRSGTIVALIDRDLITTSDTDNYGINWLKPAGINVYAELTGNQRVLNPSWGMTAVTSEDHPAQSDMITDDQPTRERIAQLAAARHYRNATSDNANHGAIYEASKAHMMAMGVAAYPDMSGEEIYELIHSFNEGESLRDLVEIFRENRSASIADDAQWQAIAIGDEHYESLNPETNELPYDAERIWDAENAAAEGEDIRAEYEAEIAEEPTQCYCPNDAESCPSCNGHERLVDELIAEIYADDRLMYLTPKGVFVSGNYVNRMRRIADVQRGNASGFPLRRQHMIDDAPNLFALIDSTFDAGEITFGEADREKRRIRAHCRPSVLTGRKHKPSGKRRNRR